MCICASMCVWAQDTICVRFARARDRPPSSGTGTGTGPGGGGGGGTGIAEGTAGVTALPSCQPEVGDDNDSDNDNDSDSSVGANEGKQSKPSKAAAKPAKSECL